MNKNKGHIIKNVKPGSIAEEMGLEPGDKIMAVDGTVIEDVFDFEFRQVLPCNFEVQIPYYSARQQAKLHQYLHLKKFYLY